MWRFSLLLGLLVLISPAKADNYAATAGSGLTFGAKSIGGVLYPWWIPSNSSGTELFTSGNAGYVQFPSAQAVTATLGAETTKVIGTVNQGTSPWVVSNGGTFAVQASIASGGVAAGAYVSGSVLSGAFASGSLAAGSMVDLLTMRGVVAAGTAPADALIGGAIYNSTPLTVANTQSAALQSDANGFLKVNVAAGSSGTSLLDEAAFTQGTTAITPIGCLYIGSYASITTGHAGVLSCTAAGSLHTTVDNANANGAAAAASSSPVTPSNQPVGAATFTPAQITVASTATVVAAARTGVSGTGRVSITVTNTTTTAIYLGGSGVTTSTGTLLPGIVGASVTINTTAAVYGIVASSTAVVTEFETY